MMKHAVISALLIVLTLGLASGSPLFYERPKILNKVEFTDANVDGGRIDPLIDVSEEEEGNITVSSFTDTNDVGGNDSKEEHSPDDTVDVDAATERTATERAIRTDAPNGEGDETTDSVRKVTAAASPKPVTSGTANSSETDRSNVKGDREGTSPRGSVPSKTSGRDTNSTAESEASRQTTSAGVTSEKAVHSSQMPTTQTNGTTFETRTPPSSSENELESTTEIDINSATTTETIQNNNNMDTPIHTSEDATTRQSVTTPSMIPSENISLTTTESTNPPETILSVSNENWSVEVMETTTFMSTGEEKVSTSSFESTTNWINSTTHSSTEASSTDDDHTTTASFRSFPVTDATTSGFVTTPEEEKSSTLSSYTVSINDGSLEYSETMVLPTTSEATTSSSTPEMAIDSEDSDELILGASTPTTVVSETTSTEIASTTAISAEQRTSTESQVRETSRQETSNGDAATTTPTMISSAGYSESTEKDFTATTITENMSAEMVTTSEASGGVTPPSLEEMSTFTTVGHSSESGEFLMTSTMENVLTTDSSTLVTTTVISNSGSDMETSHETTTTEVTTIALPTETTSFRETTTVSTETEGGILSTITSIVTNVQGAAITTTEKFVQDTTTSLVEHTEETTSSVVVEKFSPATEELVSDTSVTNEITGEEVTTSKPTETESVSTEEVIRETTTIAVTNVEENTTILSNVDQSRTTSEMMSGESVTVETSNETVIFTPQEKFTEATPMFSQSSEEATSEEFKKDFHTTAEPSTTTDSVETSAREIVEELSTTANVAITRTPTTIKISTDITDLENPAEGHRNDSEGHDFTTTEQIETLTSAVVVQNTEKTHGIASTTAPIDNTGVFFTDAPAPTTEEVPEQSTTSVLDLGDVTTGTAEATTTQDSAEEFTIKRVVGQTEDPVSVASATTAPSITILTSTPLAIEEHEEDSEDRFRTDLNKSTMITSSPLEISTRESSRGLVETTEQTYTMSASTTSRNTVEEHEKGSEDVNSLEYTEPTLTLEMITQESSRGLVETTEQTYAMSASTTSRNIIEEHEKGTEDVNSLEYTEPTLTSETTTQEISRGLVETTKPTTTMPASTSHNNTEGHEKDADDETSLQDTQSTLPAEITTQESSFDSVETTEPSAIMSASITLRNDTIEQHEKDPMDETSPQQSESTPPAEVTTQESSRGLVETTTDYTTVADTTERTSSFTPPTTPSSVTSSADKVFAVKKELAITSTTTKQLTEVDRKGIASLTSETTTVLPVTSPARPGHQDVSESVPRSAKNVTLQNPLERFDDIPGATIPPEKELPSTSDALSTPAEESSSTAHPAHHLLVLVPIVMVQLRSSLGAFT